MGFHARVDRQHCWDKMNNNRAGKTNHWPANKTRCYKDPSMAGGHQARGQADL